MKWIRKYDGGLFEATTLAGTRYSITLHDGSGKFAHNRRYVVREDGKVIGGSRLLKDAKVLADQAAAGELEQ